MLRCPLCHRRLAQGMICPRDGKAVAAVSQLQAAPLAQPAVSGFTLVEPLGRGGFGAVWHAVRDDGLDVAIKVGHTSDIQLQERFEREADAMRSIGPPYVPQLYQSGLLHDGRPYLTMERLLGSTLGATIDRSPSPLPLADFHKIACLLLDCVQVIHSKRIVHRDLKPDNVFLADTRTKLIDFGIARNLTARGPTQTRAGIILGSFEYMPPEQILGQTDITEQADIYSIGVIFYELLTLRTPYVGDRNALEYGHLVLRPPRPSQFASVPVPLENVILRCLSKNPDHRYPAAHAVLEALTDAITRGPPQQKSPPPPQDKTASISSSRQKVNVGMLFFQLEKGLSDLVTMLQPYGGTVAHLAGHQCVVVISSHLSDNPVRRALLVAETLVNKGFCTRTMVDQANVIIRMRPTGSPWYHSPLFTQKSKFPSETDPPGVMVSQAALDVLPSLASTPISERDGYHALVDTGPESRTSPSILSAQTCFVGRDIELQALLDDAEMAIHSRQPRVATVLAEPGLGKSHLCSILSEALNQRFAESQFLHIHAREPTGGDGDETLRDFIQTSLDLPPGVDMETATTLLQHRFGKLSNDILGAIALLLGWLSKDDPLIQSLRAAPSVLRAALARFGSQALFMRALDKPLIVLLDDVHWMDPTTLEAIEQASVAPVPLWVCAFGRPNFQQARPGWGQRASHHCIVHLEPLDRKSAETLCRHLLLPATQVPLSVIDRLLDQSHSIPLLLLQLVQGLRREGLLLKKQAGGQGYYLDTDLLDKLPDVPLIEWFANREIARLSPELASHVRLAASLAPDFTVREMEGIVSTMAPNVANAFPVDAKAGLIHLQQAGIVVEHDKDSFSFRHRLVRDMVAQTLDDSSRLGIHQAAVQYYRTTKDIPDALRLPRLAWHATQAGEPAEASATYLWLAEQKKSDHNYLDAELFYTRALEYLNPSDDILRLVAFRGRGIMRYRLGRYDDSLGDFAHARKLAEQQNAAVMQVEILLDEAMALDWIDEWRQSKLLAEQAQELMTSIISSPLLEARLTSAFGRSACRFDQIKEGITLLVEAARLAEQFGDEGYEIFVTSNLLAGFAMPFLGMLTEAEERLEQVRSLCEQKGDDLHLSAMQQNRLCLWIAKNDKNPFLADLHAVLSQARRIGNASIERNANLNAGYFFYWRGDYDDSEPYIRRTIELNEQLSRFGYKPDAVVLLARLLWARGDTKGSSALVDQVKQHQLQALAASKVELLLLPSEQVLFEVISLALKEGHNTSEWDTVVERAHQFSQGQEILEVLEIRGIVAMENKDYQTAYHSFDQALKAGAHIPNVMSERIRQRLAHCSTFLSN